jgi:2-polyprenyl-6-methoxyphenol hydroxylase-like FAD-dependent oxidoreductase
LAQGLKRAGISFTVYERDRTADARLQGYRLNIEPIGARALHECLPPEIWSLLIATAGDTGAGMGVYDERLKELMREDARPRPATPIDDTHAVSRITLRKLLLSGIEADVIFDKEFVRYEKTGDDMITAFFADGSSATGSVLVGADGARSRVRRQLLPHARDIDTPGVGVGGKLPLNPETEAWLPPGILSGKNMVLPARDFLFTATFRRRTVPEARGAHNASNRIVEVEDRDYLMWAFVAHRSIYPAGVDELHGQALRDLVIWRMSGWHPALRRLVAESNENTIDLFQFRAAARVRPWPSANVTLLGDAIHAMPPVGGIGGNIALCDASRLCGALDRVAKGNALVATALSAYEADMIKRGFAAVAQSRLYLQLAIFPSRLLRAIARTFFRLCGTFPPLRRAIFNEASSAAPGMGPK